jgi:hypothetical protein
VPPTTAAVRGTAGPVGMLTLLYGAFSITGATEQVMFVHFAEPGSTDDAALPKLAASAGTASSTDVTMNRGTSGSSGIRPLA